MALQIRNKFPQVYEDYIAELHEGQLFLGNTIITEVDAVNQLYVASLCGQYKYGRKGLFTDYDAFEASLRKVKVYNDRIGELPVYIPYFIGCGLAGGDWNIISRIIDEHIPKAIICVL